MPIFQTFKNIFLVFFHWYWNNRTTITTWLKKETDHNFTLHWRYNGRYGVSNQRLHDCSLNCLFMIKKASKLRVTGLSAGNSPVTGELPSQRASNAENVPFDDVSWGTQEYLRSDDCPNRKCITRPNAYFKASYCIICMKFIICKQRLNMQGDGGDPEYMLWSLGQYNRIRYT